MIESCLNCVRKHLAQSIILIIESRLGYPEHIWLAIGHMAEAESESIQKYPKLAESIRQERIKVIKATNDNIIYDPKIMELIGTATEIKKREIKYG
jgi:hypothetical protein